MPSSAPAPQPRDGAQHGLGLVAVYALQRLQGALLAAGAQLAVAKTGDHAQLVTTEGSVMDELTDGAARKATSVARKASGALKQATTSARRSIAGAKGGAASKSTRGGARKASTRKSTGARKSTSARGGTGGRR